MRKTLTLLLLSLATQAGAKCGKLCVYDWWETATPASVQAELDAGEYFMVEGADGWAPLHRAASYFSYEAEKIQILVVSGVTATDGDDKNLSDYAEVNGLIKEIKYLCSSNVICKIKFHR